MAETRPERGTEEWRNEQASIQRQLDECLVSMADHEFAGPEELEAAARTLCQVYSHDGFRHRYSNIVDIVEDSGSDYSLDEAAKERLERFSTSVEAAQARATCLTGNLRQLFTYVPGSDPGIKDETPILKLQGLPQFEKLYDHVSLEAKRSGYSGQRSRVLYAELNEAEDTVDRANRRAEKANRKAKSLQRETIAILGIFSAITLAFNASVSFTTSSISEANAVGTNIFQVAFVISVVGAFLFNILYATFAFVHRIVEGRHEGDGRQGQFLKPWQLLIIELLIVILIVAFGVLASGWLPPLCIPS